VSITPFKPKQKKKGRTQADVDQIIYWLTGYDKKTLQKHIDNKADLETFFAVTYLEVLLGIYIYKDLPLIKQ